MAEFAFEYWERVDKLRGNKPLSEIAEAMGIKEQSLRNMRSECRYPKLSASRQLATYLGTTVDYLMTGVPGSPLIQSTSFDYVEDAMTKDAVLADILASLIKQIKGDK